KMIVYNNNLFDKYKHLLTEEQDLIELINTQVGDGLFPKCGSKLFSKLGEQQRTDRVINAAINRNPDIINHINDINQRKENIKQIIFQRSIGKKLFNNDIYDFIITDFTDYEIMELFELLSKNALIKKY